MVSTTDGQAEYRARLVAKLLTIAGRTDVPIALGAGKPSGEERERSVIGDFQLADYRGRVHRDGVQALVDAINGSSEPLTIIAIGPFQTLAAALAKDPNIAAKAHLIGMQGSVFKGYGGSPTPAAEFNVKTDVVAAQKVLSAPWRSIAITPLDTCGLPGVSIGGTQFESLRRSTDPLARAIIESYAAWSGKDEATLTASTTLFDTVAIYLARPTEPSLLTCRDLNIAVSDAGMTIVNERGRAMSVATDWIDLVAYRDRLMKTLLPSP
jgi:inosine-uridine nucleoside N-ribohydrolase